MLWPDRMLALRKRCARAAITLLSVLLVSTMAFVAATGPAAGSVDTDHAQITQLEQRIAAQGARLKELVSRYNDAEAHLTALNVNIDRDERILASDHRAEAAATAVLSKIAVDAYVNGGEINLYSPLAFTDNAGNLHSMFEQSRYLGAVNAKMWSALDRLKAAHADTRADESALKSEQQQATATLRQLDKAHRAAQAAIAADETMLGKVKGNLRAVLAEATEAHEAQERANERALAAPLLAAPPRVPAPPATPSASSPSSRPAPSAPVTELEPLQPSFPAPPPPPLSPSPGGYANPIRAVNALNPERIDQGVDYSGFGPIYAIGNGVVLSTSIPGWPGGTYIAYRLTNGPAAGLVVYSAEDISPSVQVGDRVTASTVLGQVYAGPDGIEIGWGDPTRIGNTMARTYGQFNGSNSSAFGANFSRLLQSLGAPGGVLQNNPPTGALPAGWPSW